MNELYVDLQTMCARVYMPSHAGQISFLMLNELTALKAFEVLRPCGVRSRIATLFYFRFTQIDYSQRQEPDPQHGSASCQDDAFAQEPPLRLCPAALYSRALPCRALWHRPKPLSWRCPPTERSPVFCSRPLHRSARDLKTLGRI